MKTSINRVRAGSVFALAGCAMVLSGCKGKAFTITPAQEISLGTAAIRTLELKYPATPAEARRVLKLGLPLRNGARRDIPYSFHALDIAEPRVISLPGGPIAVTTGLLRTATDTQVTALMAHEMGHAELSQFQSLYHRRKDSMAITGFITGGMSLLTVARDEKLVREWSFSPGWTEQEEIKADQAGLEILAGAGYSTKFMEDLLSAPPLAMEHVTHRLVEVQESLTRGNGGAPSTGSGVEDGKDKETAERG